MSPWSKKRKASLWRSHQEGRKVQKIGQSVLFVVLILVIIIGVERGMAVKKFLETPQTKILGVSTQNTSLSPGRANFLLNTKPVLVASFVPQEKTLTVLALPDDLYLDIGEGKELLQISSIYNKASSESPSSAPKILTEAVENALGLPIDGYFEVAGTRYQVSEEEVKKLKQQISDVTLLTKILDLPTFLSKNLKTNLPPGDLLELWWQVRQVRYDKIRYLELDKQSLTQKILLPSGDEGQMPDPVAVDNFVSKIFFDPKIKKENLKIEVLNATQTLGLADKKARLINNLGGDVVNVDNYQFGQVKKSFILTGVEQKDSYTAKRLSNMLFYDITEGTLPNQRGDIVVVVAE